MPALVRQFVQNIWFDGNPYIFGIATCGERSGGALFNVKRLLEEKGTTLSAGFVFVMPENYIGPIDLMGDAPRRKEKYTVAKSRIPAVAAAIRDRKLNLPEGSDSVILKIGVRISNALATSVLTPPSGFMQLPHAIIAGSAGGYVQPVI